MLRIGGLMLVLALVTQGRPATGKVNSTYDKTADFKTFQTYGWIQGQHAFNPDAHKAIVAAVDGEMTAIGLRKVEGRSGDVTVRYLAVRSTSVDLDKLHELEKTGGAAAGANYSVGRLVIIMEDARSNRQLWAADGLERLDPAAGAIEEAVKRVVSRMFETYPTQQKRR